MNDLEALERRAAEYLDVAALELAELRGTAAHVIATGLPELRRFDPLQPRDPHNGEWVGTPGRAAASGLKDALKLAEKIDLAPDEKLVGSSKIDGDAGGIRMALTRSPDGWSLRLGAGGEEYGRASRSEGIAAWDGNASRPDLSSADRTRLDDEESALDYEYDSASAERRKEIQTRLDGIREQLTDQGFNGTAKLDEYSMRRLGDKIRPAMAEAVEQLKLETAAYEEFEQGKASPARLAELQQIARAVPGSPGYEGIVFASGSVPGSAWGDVHFSVELDDPTVGVYLKLGVKPKDAPSDWGNDKDWQGSFDDLETKRFLRQLDGYVRVAAS